MLPLTVVIPTYNRRDLLHQALESVVSQTAPAQEIIVVDDGSTEPLADVAEAFGARFIRQDNAGSSAARNCGMQAARNEWIAFLDSDDLWQPQKLERQWAALQAHAADICFTDMILFDQAGIVAQSILRPVGQAPDNHVADVRTAYRLVRDCSQSDGAVVVCRSRDLRVALARYNVIFPSTVIVRRSKALAVGGFLPELQICQDWDFVLRLCKQDVTALALEIPLVRYRMHDDNVSGNYVRSARMVSRMIERAARRPDEYPTEVHARWKRYLPIYTTSAARVAIRGGQFKIAHELLTRRFHLNPDPSAASWLFLATALDSPVGNVLYRFARRLHEVTFGAARAASRRAC